MSSVIVILISKACSGRERNGRFDLLDEVARVADLARFRLPWSCECVKVLTMDRERILAILRRHAPELKAAGVTHLRVFGSVARGEASVTSDVDLLAEFEPSKRLTLVTLGALEGKLAEMLGATVDLSSAAWMRERVRERALREAVLVF
jgi:predicted nucleotidyltransferase